MLLANLVKCPKANLSPLNFPKLSVFEEDAHRAKFTALQGLPTVSVLGLGLLGCAFLLLILLEADTLGRAHWGQPVHLRLHLGEASLDGLTQGGVTPEVFRLDPSHQLPAPFHQGCQVLVVAKIPGVEDL
jgi:hypothetical protein